MVEVSRVVMCGFASDYHAGVGGGDGGLMAMAVFGLRPLARRCAVEILYVSAMSCVGSSSLRESDNSRMIVS